eukprot:jgi/Bigna1/50830/estExt_Genewise1.C_980005
MSGADQVKKELELALLTCLSKQESIANSLEFATGLTSITHPNKPKLLIDVIKSLKASRIVEAKSVTKQVSVLTKDGDRWLEEGAPEIQILKILETPMDKKTLLANVKGLGKAANPGLGVAMKNKWIGKGEGGLIERKVNVAEIPDEVQAQLMKVKKEEEVNAKTLKDLKKRKMITSQKINWYKVTKGPSFTLERKEVATDITQELLQGDKWKDCEFKSYSMTIEPKMQSVGALHPLLKVRTEFRQILLEMGFSEMPTNNFIESSFWNFDTLFQPQQHPARDAHDTFFLKQPKECLKLIDDYVERVKTMHEKGGHGSIGYRYDWSLDESKKNILRTHTTAVSSRMLYKLAQEKEFKPRKYFSIDRVFRNEHLDTTHLAEFHQVEGLIADKGLSLSNLIGTIKSFFTRIGIDDVKFKPAYNPYTEPSMEIFGFSKELKKWIEIGNSGMFRPEMLAPMGLPEDVSVIAWGLSLERPTMIKYGYKNIRDLFGHEVDLDLIYKNPLCRY